MQRQLGKNIFNCYVKSCMVEKYISQDDWNSINGKKYHEENKVE